MKKQRQNRITLESIPKTNVFKLPEGYFMSLPKDIENKIPESNASLKANIYKVPDNYFDTLPDKISSRLPHAIKLPESGAVYTTPDGYFEDLPSKIQEKINQNKKSVETPVISLIPAVRYAVAAGLIAAVLMCSVFLYKRFSSEETVIVKKEEKKEELVVANTLIASLSKKDIKQYLEDQGEIDVNQLIKYSSSDKKKKIKKELEKSILDIKLEEKEKKAIEMELDDIDVMDLYPEI